MPLGKDTENILDPLLATFDDKLTTDISGQIAETYISGQTEMITWGKTKGGVPIAYEGPPISQAIDWAEKHGATLVKGLDEETKKRLAHTVSQGIENKRGIPGLSRDIRKTFGDMSKYRSELIARTETANALSTASLDSMKDMGVDGKEWITAGDAQVSDECDANEAEGVIPVNQPFTSGPMAPPQHPDCRCTVSPARFKGQPYIGEPVEPTIPTPLKKTEKDIATTKSWTQKNVDYSPGNKTGQTVINQISKEVPVKDLRTCARVAVLDGEAYVPGVVRQYKGQYINGVFNKGTRIIEISAKGTPSTVTHEFGHAVMNTLPRSSIVRIEKAFEVSKQKGIGFVSEYAKTNIDEYFAEAYRLYHSAPDVLRVKNEPIFKILFKRYNP